VPLLIFREVEEMVGEVKHRIGVLGDQVDATWDEKRLALLMKLVSYINSMTWLSHESLRQKVRVFLQSRYSYKHVSSEFGVSIKQAHKAVSYASQCLNRRIGSSLILIRQGHLEAAEREIAVVTGVIDSSSWFVGGITDRFTPRKSTGVALSDCRRELSFLSAFSQLRFEHIVASLSKDRIDHLLYVLLSLDPTYIRERSILWDCLVDCKSTVAECMESLNDEYIWSTLSDGGVLES
jgi:predicted transcriptional regulator with HTH domain